MSLIISAFKNSGLIIKYGWPFILLIGLFFARQRMKKFPIDAIIFEKRGENLIKTNDRVGRINDEKAGITYYKLKKHKDTIPIYNFDWVIHNISKPTNFLEKLVDILQGNIGTVMLFKYGSKQYKPVQVRIKDQLKTEYKEVRDSKGNPITIQVYQPFDPRDKLGALEFEVIDWDNMNFMVQEQRASIERRKNHADWIKTIAIPAAMIGGAALVAIFVLKFSFDYAADTRAIAGTAPAPAPNVNPDIPIAGDLFAPGN